MRRSHTELIEEVSRNLRPAPRIQQAAATVVAELTARGAVFNGVHLRVEADADFQRYANGAEVRSRALIAAQGAGSTNLTRGFRMAVQVHVAHRHRHTSCVLILS